MTPAIALLEKQKIKFEILSYEHDANNGHYGLEAVEKLNLNSDQVFKTLVLETHEGELIVAITPVSQQVNLKQLAKVAKTKKMALAAPQKVNASTGYILGGVSPIGQKKRLKTYIHSSASEFEIIYVSAGKRGLELKLAIDDIAELTKATFAVF
ncbi:MULTISPECIES: Cys-tRNA(Pro) deacylase [Pseudoalteromonas]|jgi:Cys-tRNA(Pro)/Cys-tRNA(Cys) deacylase|uniref:Cys-tRNA(Pro)/Cys-tRNA(Cys) deacylase n=1 Tax=Pseudoalteromonas marina TaxID=267375 RepID=A0ABT9FF98_9GAMM|nr:MULTISPECIES: Cys-tRNA(Pro) deacylase [Pseudoalteromonas]EAW29019.1 putative ala-tRNA(Pro) deacylase [Alteromonadales bacterium TW-7]MDP2484792.1 Cys-tRNA(Pro) deacylase [Pseudoalteromonas marina]MDP2565349.1 Cys-tRNA(Pro) deacylase [Pseudoalteromonas marina]BBW93597.1 Cys-tRNA(Pro)/Cys-tRNA(Cys) deacylase [Pseudoalteromonas sp. PS1M3]GAA74245.1 Cys-tRNA(Pro)/Cys-tRNA(Cys) deacylase ybaK [Pseudoalteromonas sp. BSi20480]